MLERYALSPMRDLWTPEAQYEAWLRVELAALSALEELGIVPPGVTEKARVKGHINPQRIAALERQIGHDLMAFLWALEEEIGPEGRWLHFGLTSSDVKDTALALLLSSALDLLRERADQLGEALKDLALQHKHTPILGRTHGQWAEPTTFGLKVLGWYDELTRVRARLARAREAVAVGKLSGAVGTFAHFPPEAEEIALARLGLAPCPITTQVISRDRHAEVLFTLAAAASLVEKIALEIRHLARTEVGEVAEGRPEGSSAMPHKENPILSERLCGLARVVRSSLGPALEDNALWHERDMSHSSVERLLLPQAFILGDYLLERGTRLIRELRVFPEVMERRIEEAQGLPFSEGLLLALVRAGMGRREAHELVADLSRRAKEGGRSLRELAQEDPKIRELGLDLGRIFDLSGVLSNVDAIFSRVLGE